MSIESIKAEYREFLSRFFDEGDRNGFNPEDNAKDIAYGNSLREAGMTDVEMYEFLEKEKASWVKRMKEAKREPNFFEVFFNHTREEHAAWFTRNLKRKRIL